MKDADCVAAAPILFFYSSILLYIARDLSCHDRQSHLGRSLIFVADE